MALWHYIQYRAIGHIGHIPLFANSPITCTIYRLTTSMLTREWHSRCCGMAATVVNQGIMNIPDTADELLKRIDDLGLVDEDLEHFLMRTPVEPCEMDLDIPPKSVIEYWCSACYDDLPCKKHQGP